MSKYDVTLLGELKFSFEAESDTTVELCGVPCALFYDGDGETEKTVAYFPLFTVMGVVKLKDSIE